MEIKKKRKIYSLSIGYDRFLVEYSSNVKKKKILGRFFFAFGNQKKKKKADPFLVSAGFLSFRINTQNVCRNGGSKESTEVEIIAGAEKHPNDEALHKINFPDMKERCDASIETEGPMRQPHQIQGLNRPVMSISAQQCSVFLSQTFMCC